MSSSVQDRKPPSAGTKVESGKQAPVTKESAGTVATGSLADESNRDGGGFASNRGIHSEDTDASDLKSSSQANKHPGAPGSKADRGSNESHAGIAPSYVNAQQHTDPDGPHGKNLKEGDWDESKAEDGLKKALNSEPGSKNDPSRLAEQQFGLKESKGARDSGPVKNKTAFDTLDSETPS
ncbi:hypothetical protein G7046_g5958 [Stylonectria norvegica]|nr:hypothetical protein G7046_g5958 [Stylonectria norvegica]